MELPEVRDAGKETLQSIKERLVKEYRKDFFPDIYVNNGTISNDKYQS